MGKNTDSLIVVKKLKKYFDIKDGFLKSRFLKAVNGVSFSINKGETLGLVGESGCGKSTLGKTLLRLYEPTEGEIIYKGKSITTKDDIREFKRMTSMVFQDPYSSLNPRMTVSDLIAEPLDIYSAYKNKTERKNRIKELMDCVGLSEEHALRYAHEFSGGQRQRIGIARSLAMHPDFIVCDEPVSALDVSIQAQIINMFEELQKKLNLTYLFIAHDLLVVRHISDRIAVMYLGKIVEISTAEKVYAEPLHPYSKALISAVLNPEVKSASKNNRIILSGDIPSPVNLPSGCNFHTRCPYATELCSVEIPVLREVTSNHFVACHRAEEINI